MSRALKEIDRMRTQAWRQFSGDVKTTGKRLKKAGSVYIKSHPLVILGGGAAVGALLMAGLRRRPKVAQPSGVLKYLRIARFWLGRAVVLATDWAERTYLKNEEVCQSR